MKAPLHHKIIHTSEWPADDYSIGAYILSTVADPYTEHLQIKPTDSVLDVGCGEGSYSLKLIKQFPMDSFVGLDRSENMVQLARKTVAHPKVKFEMGDVMTMNYSKQFDYIVSFWCLHWVHDLRLALHKIHRALKEKGQFFALLPSDDGEFYKAFMQVKLSKKFPVLNHFVPPIDYKKLHNLIYHLDDMPFTTLKVELNHHVITLPSLDFFQKFVKGIPFYEGQVADDEIIKIKQTMVDMYDEKCRKNNQGKYLFDFHVYCIKAMK